MKLADNREMKTAPLNLAQKIPFGFLENLFFSYSKILETFKNKSFYSFFFGKIGISLKLLKKIKNSLLKNPNQRFAEPDSMEPFRLSVISQF